MEQLREYWAWVEQYQALEVALIVIGSFVLARIVDWIVRKVLLGWTHRTSWEIDDELVRILPFRQRTGVRMYDQIVDEPRLSAWAPP